MQQTQQLQKHHVEQLIQLCRLDKTQCKQVTIDLYLKELAVEHGVASWLYYQYKNLKLQHQIAEPILKRWKQQYITNSIAYQQKQTVFKQINTILTKVNIPVIALKGIALSGTLYPDEATRPMGDIDILVPEEKAMEALSLLLNKGGRLGYLPRSPLHEKVHSHLRAITFKGVLIEIHQRLFSLGNPYHKPLFFFNHTTTIKKGDFEFKILNDDQQINHLLGHAASNLKNGGLRFGWLLDIALVLSKQSNIDEFVKKALSFNSKKRKEIHTIVKMAMLLLPRYQQEKFIELSDHKSIVELIYEGMLKKDVTKIMRIINLHEIKQTPGISNKIQLAFRELFPVKSYMLQWGGGNEKRLWRLYIKRLFRF